MPFAKLYPLLAAKALRHGRAQEEVDEVLCWLTGYSRPELLAQTRNGADVRALFAGAPHLNSAREQIQGTVCGVRVEEVRPPLLREIRHMDQLINELAKGEPLDKILRQKR